MAHAQSRTWKHPSVVQNEARNKLNRQRGRFCPRSDFFTLNFDRAKHDEECGQLLYNFNIRESDFKTYAKNFHNDEVEADKIFRAGRGDHRPTPAEVRPTLRTAEV